jgi:D-erythrose 4-phosphate dehydrogenase
VHLLKYDSTHGRFSHPVAFEEGGLRIADRFTHLSHETEPSNVHWGDRGVDVVIDCTGAEFSRASASAHLGRGVGRVLLSQPASVDVDSTIIWGLNHSLLAPNMSVISAGSCTSNALMPVLSVIDRAFGINAGIVTTIHSAMNDQPVIDAYHHTDLRKTRAAFNSVIPVETGLAQGVERFFPHLSDKISARALRVPTLNVSSLDVVLSVDKSTSAHEVNAAISESLDDFDGVLAVNSEPLASCDFLGAEASSIVDTTQTQVSNGHLIKLMIWFDNEWAFVNRMVDIVLRLSDFVAEESSS